MLALTVLLFRPKRFIHNHNLSVYTILRHLEEGNSVDWVTIGARIRRQREYFGYTRDQFAELLDVTPKFCSDTERVYAEQVLKIFLIAMNSKKELP